jgi:hypothetical protein
VAALVIGGTAAGALAVVRARQHRRRNETGLQALERSVRDVAGDLRRRIGR